MNILNLGEIINLEHDYSDRINCTCGAELKDCSFWTEVRQELEKMPPDFTYSLKEKQQREFLDQRGGFFKLRLITGLSVASLLDEQQLLKYQKKNISLFNAVSAVSDEAKYFVDLSKTPERLEALLDCPELDIYCIYLKRNLKSVYASTLKRPKKTRSAYGFKSLREAIWLTLRHKHSNRIFAKLPPDRRLVLDWDDLVSNPKNELNTIFKWLSLPSINANGIREVDTSKQHVYVGNRWLFRLENPIISIDKKDRKDILNRFQNLAYHIFIHSLNKKSP
jgi:hypothetical protein